MAKRRKESLIFLVSSVVLVFAAVLWYVNTAPALGATPSDGCMACHLDAGTMESMYEIPEASAGAG
ncbi:MAG: hypothetical protein R6U08_04715 [Bacillota bacterium]